MTKSSAWKMVGIVLVFCVATVIASPAQTFSTLYSFCPQQYCPDGEYPLGRLVQATDGNFYGTTFNGGQGPGTVYKLTSSGTLTVLHSFTAYSDGAEPYAGLIQATDGNFYGVTTIGGRTLGTVFKITPSGTFTSLHVFAGYPTDGGNPWPPLLQASDGNFYGTTYEGGAPNVGTVFKITAAGSLTIVHTFCAQTNCPDGANPQGGLVQGSDGNLYGTAVGGGTNGEGTVFKITTSGTLTTLHSFAITDGAAPSGTLVKASDGNFYGTTYEGGASNAGTVFKITPSGSLTTLYSFSGADGRVPYAGLLQTSDGNFYGTTYEGGGATDYGTVFAITPSGTLTTLHIFTGADGANPYAGLMQATNGNLYGATKAGGTNNAGTVFELQLPPTLTVSTSGDGTVASTDGFISCPGTCSHTYSLGAQVTLNATPG
ncbi:MAG: choice-of-anchor tandem repeat GloVer-containing protein, partial [Candidatus Korobacteraceae bacterium]